MTINRRNRSFEGYLISLVLVCVLVFPVGASAQAMLSSGLNRQVVEVALNQSQILYLEQPVAKISVGNPDIADILILRSRQLYVVGKSWEPRMSPCGTVIIRWSVPSGLRLTTIWKA